VSQSINIRAFQWAYAQNNLGATAKIVLVTFAIHANDEGYSYPSVEVIASTWGMDRDTVRRQIEALLARRLIYRTKKRRGTTGQVKVYRLPKITYESSGKCRPFENHKSGDKAGHKGSISGGKSTPNNEHDEQGTKKNDELITVRTSVPTAPGNVTHPSGFVFEGHQHQNQSARNQIKWPEYVAYCASQKGKRGKDGRVHDGIPTDPGFGKWLLGQKPYWRDKVRPPDHIDGYVLHGKFYTAEEANRMGRENPELLIKFRRATKSGDEVHVIDSPRVLLKNLHDTSHQSRAGWTREGYGGCHGQGLQKERA
jgi:helix-turn-helix protein